MSGEKIMQKIQRLVCFIATRVLFYALKVLVKRDSRVKSAFAAYRAGYVFRLNAGMEKEDARLTFRVLENGGLEKTGDDVAADMEITIKSTSEAFKVFTGMTGIAQTYAAHGFFVKGNPYDTMGLVHGLELAEAYLFPKILARRILARVPSKRCSVGIVYLGLVCGLIKDSFQ